MVSITEENYLKSLLQLQLNKGNEEGVGTNELAEHLSIKPTTANDMLKKLKAKKWVDYEKYGKIFLSIEGKKIAVEVLRKHRLWETFLYKKLSFTWDEVHEVAEQLEHIQSVKLIDKIDALLEFPEFDPHGEIIPNKNGDYKIHFKKTLDEVAIGHNCKMVAVNDNTTTFLQYVVKVGLGINNIIKVVSKQCFDNTMEIDVGGHISNVSQRFAKNIFVVCTQCEHPKTCSNTHF
ncbi:MAG: metal-dependent transcriptional regulator [Sphingobacteriales bacterium]|nr:MAG: metal-dependent transcriptional regulator [Sphingobacteriales bacterium]TAF78421.1 MAG: metal-dependent transcriptional regulator [Sphingobacteriales bacterium]